jgi:hypothetical protein
MVKLRPLGKREKRSMANAPVRRCAPDCYFFKNGGAGCGFYMDEKVTYGEACMYDLVKMREYADAFRTGETDIVKADASTIAAQSMSLVQNMLQRVAIEGATVEEPIQDNRGAVIRIPDPNWDGTGERAMVVAMKVREHPLIAKAMAMAKSLGISFDQFKLTPKSADEKAAVAGHIIIGDQKDLTVVLAERRVIEEKFMLAIKKGTKRTEEDPVYQQLLREGDIIE